MGNKTSYTKTDGEHPFTGSTRNPHSIISEEDYLPMPRRMRQQLLKSRKIQRVLPNGATSNPNTCTFPDHHVSFSSEVEDPHKNVVQNKNECVENKNEAEVDIGKPDVLTDLNQSSQEINTYTSDVTPIVTIFNPIDVDEKSKSLPNTVVGEGEEIPHFTQDSSQRNSQMTNRKFSLINMNIDVAKSQFTLSLEERLRKSKRELGFDDNLNGWKEFSFKLETPKDSGKRNDIVENTLDYTSVKGNNFEDAKEKVLDSTSVKGNNVEDAKEKVLDSISVKENSVGDAKGSNVSLELCTIKRQILGLCSVERPQLLHNKREFESTVFGDELGRGDTINRLFRPHSKKDSCPCDLCTLAFLTGMNGHGEGGTSVHHERKNSPINSTKSTRGVKKTIRITDISNRNKSIEVSVRSPSPDSQSSLLGIRSNLSTETKEDCTNSRIRRMFKENHLTDIKDIYTNPDSTYTDNSIEAMSPRFRRHSESQSSFLKFDKMELPKKPKLKYVKNNYRKISSSTVSPSFTSASSLSTVLSYKRVRQIFQTMIEGNRVKKRSRRTEILKFKEMEELGLGRLRNNRWYPSEHKTISIWKDMNLNSHGLQGEFKKYQKKYA